MRRPRPYTDHVANSLPSQADNRNTAGRIRRFLHSRVLRAKRDGSWFVLSHIDRALMELALRVKSKFKSLVLLRTLVGILRRLKDAAEKTNLVFLTGAKLALLYSDSAVCWGNKSAGEWKNDKRYALFLGFLQSRMRKP